MRRSVVGPAVAACIAGCSLLADTNGLTGGLRDGGAPGADATADGFADVGTDAPIGDDASRSDAPGPTCPANTKGPRMVALAGYCIDSTEVTQAQYQDFITAKGNDVSGQPVECSWNTTYAPNACNIDPIGRGTHPIVGVDWCDAVAYCKWAGKRLCGKIGGGGVSASGFVKATESQWYNACSQGGRRRYPHGDTFDSTLCNTGAASRNDTVPVGSLPGCEGGFAGIFDMSGNGSEWEDACTSSTGSPQNDQCHMRGGDFTNTNPDNNTCTYDVTDPRSARDCDTSFRCCLDL